MTDECRTDREKICLRTGTECVCTPLHTHVHLSPLRLFIQALVIGISMIVTHVIAILFFGSTLTPLYISFWLGFVAIGVIIYSENYITNSFVVASILPMTYVVSIALDVPTPDWGHGFVLVIALAVLILNKPVSVICVWGFSLIIAIWFAFVAHLIYPTEPDAVVFGFTILINAILVTLTQRHRWTIKEKPKV